MVVGLGLDVMVVSLLALLLEPTVVGAAVVLRLAESVGGNVFVAVAATEGKDERTALVGGSKVEGI